MIGIRPVRIARWMTEQCVIASRRAVTRSEIGRTMRDVHDLVGEAGLLAAHDVRPVRSQAVCGKTPDVAVSAARRTWRSKKELLAKDREIRGHWVLVRGKERHAPLLGRPEDQEP